MWLVGFCEGTAHQAGADPFLSGNLGHGLESSPPGDMLTQPYGAPSPKAEDRVRFAEDLVAGKAVEAALAQNQDYGSVPDAAVFLALGSGGMDPGGPLATERTGSRLCFILDSHFQAIPDHNALVEDLEPWKSKGYFHTMVLHFLFSFADVVGQRQGYGRQEVSSIP